MGFVVVVGGCGLPQMYVHKCTVCERERGRERERERERGRERGAGAYEYGLVH